MTKRHDKSLERVRNVQGRLLVFVVVSSVSIPLAILLHEPLSGLIRQQHVHMLRCVVVAAALPVSFELKVVGEL